MIVVVPDMFGQRYTPSTVGCALALVGLGPVRLCSRRGPRTVLALTVCLKFS